MGLGLGVPRVPMTNGAALDTLVMATTPRWINQFCPFVAAIPPLLVSSIAGFLPVTKKTTQSKEEQNITARELMEKRIITRNFLDSFVVCNAGHAYSQGLLYFFYTSCRLIILGLNSRGLFIFQ